ncbi:hypothetical protein K523DRAFT_366540 [Schizophyllum commune Tattone D]|nr:hypothetical protein K523DRAFT_366540 [Schizophyllum commune Tattone D]
MAGKKNKKSKSKGASTTSAESNWASIARLHRELGGIDNALEWSAIANVLCKHLDLPDIHTRRGLKKAYQEFDDIHRRMERAYEAGSDDWRIAGGIVAIYTKMCTDGLLRRKIHGPDFMAKLMTLIDIDHCRHLAVRALSILSHHGGPQIRKEVGRSTTIKLVDLLASSPEDGVLALHAVPVLSHCVGAMMEGMKANPSAETLQLIQYPRLLKQLIRVLHRFPTAQLVSHTISLVAQGIAAIPDLAVSTPSAFEFLVAGLSCKDHYIRACCLGAINDRFSRGYEEDAPGFLPGCHLPARLRAILTSYGYERSENGILERTWPLFGRAIHKAADDHDYVALGRTISKLVMSCEQAISLDVFSPAPRGLPFRMYIDALPHCAKALRAAGELDDADVLEIKYALTVTRQIPVVLTLARRAIARNPQHAYFHYAISLVGDRQEGLRSCKKGLRGKQTTPHLRQQLLQHAADHAFNLGIEGLQLKHEIGGATRYAEGCALMKSAMEDANKFLEEAAPDNRHRLNVLYILILLTFIMGENPVGKNIAVIQPLVRELSIAEDFAKAMGYGPRETQVRLIQKAVVRTYPAAVEEWAHVLAHADRMEHLRAPEPWETTPDELAEWLSGTGLDDEDDGHGGLHGTGAHSHGHNAHCHCMPEEFSEAKMSDFQLYRCSYCGNPSAVLRKCSGCGKTRYCDAQCQRAGWPAHKKVCGKAGTAA